MSRLASAGAKLGAAGRVAAGHVCVVPGARSWLEALRGGQGEGCLGWCGIKGSSAWAVLASVPAPTIAPS